MKLGYFITGTDTGVGKTLIASALLHQLARRGLSTVGMKPVAAGGVETPAGWINAAWINEDVEALRRASTVTADMSLTCPYLLPAAVAPHIAAAEADRYIDLATIRMKFRELAALADAVVVESVGGFRVPLNDRHDTADLAAMLGLPVILVVGMRLGCLNHALLTAEVIRTRGLTLAGWVANQIEPEMARLDQNIDALVQRLPCPLLASVPFQPEPDAQAIDLRLYV